jgi:hypothetical protein
MKTLILALAVPALVLSLSVGCARTVSHTEDTHTNMLGGTTHTDQTVTQNPDGSINTEKSKATTY